MRGMKHGDTGVGMSKDELARMVRTEAKKRKKMATDEVKFAKESLASAVFRLHEAQMKAHKMGKDSD